MKFFNNCNFCFLQIIPQDHKGAFYGVFMGQGSEYIKLSIYGKGLFVQQEVDDCGTFDIVVEIPSSYPGILSLCW